MFWNAGSNSYVAAPSSAGESNASAASSNTDLNVSATGVSVDKKKDKKEKRKDSATSNEKAMAAKIAKVSLLSRIHSAALSSAVNAIAFFRLILNRRCVFTVV